MLLAAFTKRLVRSSARRAGFLLDYRTPQTDPGLRLAVMLSANRIENVLDIGANIGQFAEDLFENGYGGRITSFEPIPHAHSRLRMKAEGNPRWTVADPVALSDKAGEATFHEASNDLASSLLPFSGSYNGEIDTIASYTVRTSRLDDISVDGRLFLKIDAQGAEMPILQGATATLSRIVGLQVEMSLSAIYKDQVLAPEINTMLEGLGFELWDVIPAFRNRTTQKLLQYDGVYFRAPGPA